ncbi:MAG: TonB-dependent receptor domain-containing protein, partial [Muribaculaceae bacterium]
FLSSKGSATDFLGFDNGFRNFNGGIDGVLLKSSAGVDLKGNGFNNDWIASESTPISDFALSAHLNRLRRFDGGSKLGLLAAINYNLSHRTLLDMENSLFGSYDVENDCENYLRRSRDNQYTQNARLGAMLNVVWLSADGNNKIELKNVFNQLGKDRYTYRNGISAQSDPEIRAEYYYSSRSTYNGQLAGSHTVGANNFDWAAGYSYADHNVPDRRRYLLSDDEKDGRYSLLTGNDVTREYTLLKEHIASLAMNYNRTFVGRVSATLKTGAYAEYRSRDYRTRSFIYAWNPSQNTLPSDFRYSNLPELLSDNTMYGDDRLYLIEEVKWRNNYGGNNTLGAAYAAVNLPLGKWDIYAGLRFEHNRMELISNTRDYERSEVNNYYDTNDFFPSMNVAYRMSQQHQMRAAYGRAINRQEFREVSSSVYYDFDLAGNVQGNPDLRACRIDNVDLRYEWYPSNGEMVSVALFGKFFDKPIEWTYTVAGGTDLVYSYKNADKAYSYGIEVDVRKNLGFIGAPWLSLIFNGALIKSRVDFSETDLDQSRPMQGQSPYLINTGVFYTNASGNFSASLLYNRIGKRIIGVGRSMGHADDAVRIPDSYEMPRNALDFTFSYRFAKQVELKMSLKDILGEAVTYKQFEEGVKLPDGTVKDVEEVTRNFTPGRNFSIALTYKF